MVNGVFFTYIFYVVKLSLGEKICGINRAQLYIKRCVILDLICFDESFKFAMDWDLILRFRDAGATFRRLPRFLGAFRVTNEQKTQTLIRTVGDLEMRRLRRRALGRVPTTREVRRVIRPYLRRHWMFDKLYQLGLARY